MSSNQETLAVYQEHFDVYNAETPQQTDAAYKVWIDSLLARVQKDIAILEIGSAFGRDAEYVKNSGYTDITPTDAVDVAVAALKERGFLNARKLNVLTDEIDGRYGLIFAVAVFLHFNEAEFESALHKLRTPLGEKGILGFTVKQGEGEEWSDHKMGAPRFFHYWQKESLQQKVEEAGYEILELKHTDDSQKWLAVTCRPAQKL
jgi:hypothetical protein